MASISDQPGTLNITAVKGDNLRTKQLTIMFDGATPVRDLSGYTFAAQVRKKKRSGTILVTLDIDDTDADTGILRVSATDTNMNVAAGTWYWDLEWVTDEATPIRQTILEGTFTITDDVTRTS